nr:TonB-dependent siderophore receptor [Delftia sp. PS-11]
MPCPPMRGGARILRSIPSATGLLLAGSLAASAGWSGHALAQPAAAQQDAAGDQRSYRIPAGPLDTVLMRFLSESGLLLSGSAALARGRSSPGVQGRFTPAGALDALLAGTGLQAQALGHGRYALQAMSTATVAAPPASTAASLAPATLPTVTVSTPRESATGPANGYLAERSATASKTDQSLFTTPASLSVVTQHQIEAQATRSLTEALRYSAGVSSEYEGVDSRFDTLALRGFSAGSVTWLNGLRLDGGAGAGNNWTRPQVDPYLLNRIEILKGPAAALYGQMVPGGMAHLSTKRAGDEGAQQSAEFTLGSYGQRRMGLDLNGRFGGQDQAAWRLLALDSRSGSQVDFVRRGRQLLAPSVQLDLARRGTLRLWASLQRDRGGNDALWLPAYGTLWPNPNGRLPVSRNPGEPGFDRFDRDQGMAGLSLEYALTSALMLHHESRLQRLRTDFQTVQSDMYSDPDPADGGWDWRSIRRYATWGRGKARALASDTRLQWTLDAGQARHTTLLGLDYYQDRFTAQRDTATVGPTASDGVLDIYAPQYGMPVGGFERLSGIGSRQGQTGLYAQHQMRWRGWHSTLGLRHDRARVSGSSHRRDGEVFDLGQRDSATTGRMGLLYDAGIWAPYMSYSTSFEPVAGVDFNGAPFKPMRGKQLELGLKLQPRPDWMLTLAAFDLRQKNRLTDDPVNGFPEQVQTGLARSRGLELEMKGRIHRNWSVIGAYTYLDTRVLQSEVPEELGQPLLFVPRHQASVWLDYTFGAQHALRGMVLGGGVRYVGATRNGDVGQPGGGYAAMAIPSHTVFDARLSMLLGVVSPALRDSELALNVSNLTNRRYVPACGGLWSCNWALQRQVSLTFTGRW